MNNVKRFLLLLVAATSLVYIFQVGSSWYSQPIALAQGTSALPGSLADVTGDGVKHQFTTSATGARWIQFICAAGNSGTAVRIGDVNISATRGDTCAAGGGVFVPEPSTTPRVYDLST